MSTFRFELKKLVRSRWLWVVLVVAILLGSGFFFWKTLEVKTVISNEVSILQDFRNRIIADRNNLEATEPERFKVFESQQPNDLEVMLTFLDKAELALMAHDSSTFIEEKLNYYRPLPQYRQMITQEVSDYTSKEKEDIYYLQSLAQKGQSYEQTSTSIFVPNFLYQLFSFLSHPIVFTFLLFICLIPFGREKESGTVHFMMGFSKSLRSYLTMSQGILFLLSLSCVLIVVGVAFFLSAYQGEGLLGDQPYTASWIVDTSYQYQTIVHFSDARLVFALLAVPLLTIYLQLFFGFNLYIRNITLANSSFFLVSMALGFWGSKLTIVGNPFRFHGFQEFLYNQPTQLDLLFSAGAGFVVSMALYVFFSREKYKARVVRN